MNRQIKFRAWVPEKKQFADSVAVFHDGSFSCEIEEQGIIVGGYNGILMQFTGLFDKNGKDIYEGDIYKDIYVPLNSDKIAYEYSHIGVISYQGGCFGRVAKIDQGVVLNKERCYSWQKDSREVYKHPTQGPDWFNKHIDAFSLEIIGNIYQNPELLKLFFKEETK